jgi:hypothetical protein
MHTISIFESVDLLYVLPLVLFVSIGVVAVGLDPRS